MRKDFLDGNYTEKEVALTIRVPKDFDREDERMLDDAFADLLYKNGYELVNSKEYRSTELLSVHRVALIRERLSEDERWIDEFWIDSSNTPSVELFKAAVEEYLRTEDGIKNIEDTCEDFNWGDAVMYIPSEAWNKHGIYVSYPSLTEQGLAPIPSENIFSLTVDQDEILIPDYETKWWREGEEKIVPAETLPEGWHWTHYDDGSGHLESPVGTSFFSYDRAPYSSEGWIEYKENSSESWGIFYGGMDEFLQHAETVICERYLSNDLFLGEHNIPAIMQQMADNAWYGRDPTTVQIQAGNNVIEISGYTYEPSYESFSATSSISLNGKTLYGLDSRNVDAYRNETYHTGAFHKLEEAVSYARFKTHGHDLILISDQRPNFEESLRNAKDRSDAQSGSSPAKSQNREI